MIIAFSGKMGTGKTTAVDYLVRTHPQKFVKINFKDALRKEITEKLSRTLVELCTLLDTIYYDDMNRWTVNRLFDEKPPVFRALMQEYGTEVRRADNEEYWADRWELSVLKALHSGKCVVTDDCRFLNEAQRVNSLGGMIVRLERDDIIDTGSHQSETEMSRIVPSAIIRTEKGDLDGLYVQLDNLIKQNETNSQKSSSPNVGASDPGSSTSADTTIKSDASGGTSLGARGTSLDARGTNDSIGKITAPHRTG